MTVIEEIKDKVDIVDLVNETGAVKLRRSGKNYTGFCPFHSNTQSPALTVFPDTGTWHCFGVCNEGGTVIDWMLKLNPGWDIKEAIGELAKKAGIQQAPRYDEPELKQRLAARVREDAYKVAMTLFQKWLLEDAEALAYVHGRGVTDETIRASGLGFSGRSTAAQVKEMRAEFAMYSIDPESPQAAVVLGFRGDTIAWAHKHGLEPRSFKEHTIHGMMDKPGLVYAHKVDGRIRYMSRRQLPGHDRSKGDDGQAVEWKCFNPYSALAGDKVPYFNHMHRRIDERIVIVEGQMDAITLGQWGIPAMALCGSAWKNLEEAIKMLRDKYEAIYFATDADTPGEAVITGKDGDFPLSAHFGPMLWIARWPKFEWSGADGRKKISKDANDLGQYFLDKEIEAEAQKEAVEAVFSQATPIVLEVAKYAGRQEGAKRQKNLDVVIPLIARMPRNAQNDMRLKLAKALFPEDLFPEYKGAPIRAFSKLVGDELKGKKNDDDGQPAEIEGTMGGWYPVNEDGTEGYLLDIIYELRTMKAKFAYAHIFLDGKQEREIKTAAFLDLEDRRLTPLVDDNIRYGTVLLPSELGALKDTRELLAKIELFLRRYFLLDNPLHYKFSALYAIFTWVFDAFDNLLYLRARGGPGTGKSELMLRLGLVCYRLMITSGVSSLAGFKGLAHIYKGTLFIDEVDNLLKEDKGEMRALLNVRAMKKQARVVTMMEVLRSDGTHGFSPSTTFVYGPTLMTMYGAFKDPGTESRCLTFDLSDKEAIELYNAGIEPGYMPPELELEAQALRNQLLHWRLKHWLPSIELTDEARKKYKLMDPLVSARINQIMRPLKVLAIYQNDQELLDELFQLGQANYLDEMTRRAGSFEALIFRAVLAAHGREEYSKYVRVGKLGTLGMVRHVLYKDLATIANEIIDAENLSEGTVKSDKDKGVKSNTVGTICRDAFRLPVFRTMNGWVVVLDEVKIEVGKLRYGMEDEEKKPEEPKPVEKPQEPKQGALEI
jgi:hypothetical protein